jgi:hypothetical protein
MAPRLWLLVPLAALMAVQATGAMETPTVQLTGSSASIWGEPETDTCDHDDTDHEVSPGDTTELEYSA